MESSTTILGVDIELSLVNNSPTMNVHVRFYTLALVLLLFAALSGQALAQSTGVVKGKIVNEAGDSLPGVAVVLSDARLDAATIYDGTFLLKGVSPGPDTLYARFSGYETVQRPITVQAGDTTAVELELQPTSAGTGTVVTQSAETDERSRIDAMLDSTQGRSGGMTVSTLRPTAQSNSTVSTEDGTNANPRDPGDLLRTRPGVDAIRRGPLGLDPTIRGLRETQVGVFLNGTRMFPASPIRMDAPTSHLDPSSIKRMQTVKGPYALTWGAGSLTAIRVKTRDLRTYVSDLVHGTFTGGYESNFNAYNGSLSLRGRPHDKLTYRFNTAWREGGDHTSGAGTTVQSDYQSAVVRGTVGYFLTPQSTLRISGGIQKQSDMDAPGRVLNADNTDTYTLSGRWSYERELGFVRSAEILGYFNSVEQGLTNDGKPTANATGFQSLDITLDSRVEVMGGRTSATLAPWSETQLKIGADVYSAYRDASRTVRTRNDGSLIADHPIWPEARITDAGTYTQLKHTFGPTWQAVGTARLDFIRASADTATATFRQEASSDLSATDVSPSGAVMLSYLPNDHWTATIGVGTAVRAPDATERYVDRVPPGSISMTSGVFLGTPNLEPERSSQIDLWVDASYSRWSLSLSGFGRRMTNFVTLSPVDLPKRLPLDPEASFRYVNGTANFYGGEATGSVDLGAGFSTELQVSYLWGQDKTTDEPALGISPLQSDFRLRYEPQGARYFVEGALHLVDDQDRIARTRGEVATDGYTTLDLRGGLRLSDRVSLQLGIENLTDREYATHLNAVNPFAARRVPEPGRVFFSDVTVSF